MSDAAIPRRCDRQPESRHDGATPTPCRSAVARYFLTTKTDCPAASGACVPGCAVLERLMAAMSLAAPFADSELELSGTVHIPACAAACGADCLLAWRADAAGLSLLGGVGGQHDPAAALIRARRTLAAPALLHAERAPAQLA
ncbi:MAG: hypothetical protein ACK4LQ_12060 [Pararhodobacter sp.]